MVRISDPAAFGGLAEFTWQTDWLTDACHGSASRVPGQPVRLPGERALARKAEQLSQGVALHPAIMPALEACFHYRNLDVSTLKELCKRWTPAVYKGFQKKSPHVALADIYESIDELKYYREHFIRI